MENMPYSMPLDVIFSYRQRTCRTYDSSLVHSDRGAFAHTACRTAVPVSSPCRTPCSGPAHEQAAKRDLGSGRPVPRSGLAVEWRSELANAQPDSRRDQWHELSRPCLRVSALLSISRLHVDQPL